MSTHALHGRPPVVLLTMMMMIRHDDDENDDDDDDDDDDHDDDDYIDVIKDDAENDAKNHNHKNCNFSEK